MKTLKDLETPRTEEGRILESARKGLVELALRGSDLRATLEACITLDDTSFCEMEMPSLREAFALIRISDEFEGLLRTGMSLSEAADEIQGSAAVSSFLEFLKERKTPEDNG